MRSLDSQQLCFCSPVSLVAGEPWRVLLEAILEILDNGSVSAFLGAFFAFLLVVATDRRRAKRKVRAIAAEIELNIALSSVKIDALRGMRADLKGRSAVHGLPLLRFNTAQIRQLTSDVVDELTSEQRQCIEALCYMMEETDNLISSAQSLAGLLTSAQPQEFIELSVPRLETLYQASIANLKRFNDMGALYVGKKYRELISRKYSWEACVDV